MYKVAGHIKKILYPLVLLSLLVGLGLPFAKPVYAATYTLYPNGVGTYTNITNASGAPHWGEVDEVVADDTTTWVRQQAGVRVDYLDTYNLPNTMPASSSISSITVYWRGSSYLDAASGPYPDIWGRSAIYIGGVTSYGASQYLEKDYAAMDTWAITWADYSDTWVTNPATGLAWTQSGINDLEIGVSLEAYASGGYAVYGGCTQVYVVVDYTAPSVPTVTTSAASGIGYVTGNHTATLNGSIDATGGENADMQGFEWGTTSNTTMPASIEPRTLTYTGNWTQVGSFGVNDFNYSMITEGLALCTTYYYRAYAHNSQGWSYGDELSFKTLCNPVIVTQDASYISLTSARLNSSITTDGGQAADVRFCYGTASGNCTYASNCTSASCNCTTYNTATAWEENIYTTGQTPYVDLTTLTANTTYYFCSQIRNDVNCFCGGQLSFTTPPTPVVIIAPTDFKGIPTAKSISLFWIKASGYNKTLIRYKLGSYPTSTSDGSLVYFDTETSRLHSGLTPGTTYYYMAWGESGGAYSSGNSTLMMTTLPAVAGNEDLPLPATPSLWFSAPDYTNMQNMPFYSIVNFFADSFEIPRSTMWYWLALVTCVAIGVLVYTTIGNYNLVMTIFVVGVSLAISSFMRLIPMWHLFPFAVLAITGIFLGERR